MVLVAAYALPTRSVAVTVTPAAWHVPASAAAVTVASSAIIAGVDRPAHEAFHQRLLREPHAAHACDKATHRRLVNRSIIIILKVSTTLFPALVGGTLAAWSL
jgi:hypothetical protein